MRPAPALFEELWMGIAFAFQWRQWERGHRGRAYHPMFVATEKCPPAAHPGCTGNPSWALFSLN